MARSRSRGAPPRSWRFRRSGTIRKNMGNDHWVLMRPILDGIAIAESRQASLERAEPDMNAVGPKSSSLVGCMTSGMHDVDSYRTPMSKHRTHLCEKAQACKDELVSRVVPIMEETHFEAKVCSSNTGACKNQYWGGGTPSLAIIITLHHHRHCPLD